MPISQPTDVETESQSAKARHFFEVTGQAEAGNLHIIALFAYTGEAIFGRSPLIGRHAGNAWPQTSHVSP